MEPELTENELAAVTELRAAVSDILTPEWDWEFNFLRWLKGHDFNLEEVRNRFLFGNKAGKG